MKHFKIYSDFKDYLRTCDLGTLSMSQYCEVSGVNSQALHKALTAQGTMYKRMRLDEIKRRCDILLDAHPRAKMPFIAARLGLPVSTTHKYFSTIYRISLKHYAARHALAEHQAREAVALLRAMPPDSRRRVLEIGAAL